MIRILITGANGFLSSYLVKLLHDGSNEIYGLEVPGNDHNEMGYFKKIYNNLDLLFRDEEEFNIIYHLAAYIPANHESKPNLKLVNSNILTTGQLALNYSKARFILASSVSVYGTPLILPITLDTPFNKPNLYGFSKLAAEAIVMNLDNYGIIRFSSIIGQGMKENTFIPQIIKSAKQNGDITVYGDGSRKQDYIDVRDAAKLCKVLGNNKQNQIILGVSGIPHTNKEVADVLTTMLSARVNYIGEDKSPSFYYDVGESHKLLEFKSDYSFEKTISKLILG